MVEYISQMVSPESRTLMLYELQLSAMEQSDWIELPQQKPKR